MRAHRTIRVAGWAVILAIAAFQAFAQRYSVGPDGVSYLDLSDAIVAGRWSGLVNLYWSPLFPALIGVARRLFGTSAAAEVPIIHAVQWLVFAGLLAAFEYFLISVLSIARRTPRAALGQSWGAAAAYALFGFFALTMTPLELTTPDTLVAAAAFLTFGALLRLPTTETQWPLHAAVLGAGLGLGCLAKSFMVPWSLVCFAVALLACRRQLARVAIAAVVWLLVVGPWTVVLSRAAGHLTFGESGSLTYVWYVNGLYAPSFGGEPPGARHAAVDSILPGAGYTGIAPGTNPTWLDPVRWNAALHPRWRARDQWETLKVFQLFYVQNLSALLFLALLIVAAPPGTRRQSWHEGWVVYLPAIAGMAAYSVVIVAARYIMPFVTAGTLMILATVPVPRRIRPLPMLLGLVALVAVESLDQRTAVGLAFVTAIYAGSLAGVSLPLRRRAAWIAAVIVAALVGYAIGPLFMGALLPIAAAALAVFIWIAARSAIRTHRPVAFARRVEIAMALLLSLSLALRFVSRVRSDSRALAQADDPRWGNVPLRVADDLRRNGVIPGTPIAVIGPQSQSYWARAGRLRIVANVPGDIAPQFWALPAAKRDALLAQFAAAGASVAVASVGPAGAPPDATWRPVAFHGYIRALR